MTLQRVKHVAFGLIDEQVCWLKNQSINQWNQSKYPLDITFHLTVLGPSTVPLRLH